MRQKILWLLLTLVLSGSILWGQHTYQNIIRDTIITRSEFLGNIYLLDGKELNLPVMEWLMSDFPPAYDEIRLAVLGDQLSIMGYGVGTLFALSGLFVYRQNRGLGEDLIQIGGIGIGSGLIFQFISGKFKKSAVGIYNEEVKAYYQQKTSSYRVGISGGEAAIIVRFD